MLYSSLPQDTIHHILSYTGELKLRNGKYMGQISKLDKRYVLLENIPKMILKHSGEPFSYPRDMMYIFIVQFSNKDHYLEVIINEYNNSKYRRVIVVYNNSRIRISLRRVRP